MKVNKGLGAPPLSKLYKAFWDLTVRGDRQEVHVHVKKGGVGLSRIFFQIIVLILGKWKSMKSNLFKDKVWLFWALTNSVTLHHFG